MSEPQEAALLPESWYCPMHGAKDRACCGRARKDKPRLVSDTLGSIPGATRVDIRHILQLLHSRCLELRASMVHDHLSRPGSVADVDLMLGDLRSVRRRLAGPVTRPPGLTDEQLAELEQRYAEPEVPPCRICGAELRVMSMGGGLRTRYACSSREASLMENSGAAYDAALEHCQGSRWDEPSSGDSRVLALIAEVRELRGKS